MHELNTISTSHYLKIQKLEPNFRKIICMNLLQIRLSSTEQTGNRLFPIVFDWYLENDKV